MLRRRLLRTLLALGVVVVLATIGFRALGRDVSWLDALYMVVVSLTGVGYGEIVDTSENPLLRVFNIVVLVGGIALMLYVFSLATAFVVEGEFGHLVRRRRMDSRIAGFTGHVLVCGAGETGTQVVEELGRTGSEVVAIDLHDDRLEHLRLGLGEPPWLATLQGDGTDPDLLERAGIGRASGIVAALPLDKDNLVITVLVRQKYPALRIVVRHLEPEMGDRMRRAGADATASPTSIGAMRLASEMLRPNVVTFLDLMLKAKSATLRIEEIAVPAGSAWAGHPLGGIDLRGRWGLGCLAMREGPNGEFLYNPDPATELREGTVLVVLGDVARVRAARESAAGRS